jgi:hypothetical protein
MSLSLSLVLASTMQSLWKNEVNALKPARRFLKARPSFIPGGGPFKIFPCRLPLFLVLQVMFMLIKLSFSAH